MVKGERGWDGWDGRRRRLPMAAGRYTWLTSSGICGFSRASVCDLYQLTVLAVVVVVKAEVLEDEVVSSSSSSSSSSGRK